AGFADWSNFEKPSTTGVKALRPCHLIHSATLGLPAQIAFCGDHLMQKARHEAGLFSLPAQRNYAASCSISTLYSPRAAAPLHFARLDTAASAPRTLPALPCHAASAGACNARP